MEEYIGATSLEHGILLSIKVLGGKESVCNAGSAEDTGSIPGLGRFPGEGHSNPLQFSCLENPMDGGAWWATVHGVAKNWTTESNLAQG